MGLSAYTEAIWSAIILTGVLIVSAPIAVKAGHRIAKEINELDELIALRKQTCLKCPDCQGRGCRKNIEANKNPV